VARHWLIQWALGSLQLNDSMQTTIRVSALSLVLITLLGCAAPPAKRDPRDPWERMNRTSYKVNDKLDRAVLRPVVHGYKKVIPSAVRTGVSNFFDNLGYPVVIVNDLLQARFLVFAKDTGRLLMNTTLGIGGILDPASQAGLQKNDNDFGLTFGYWGIPKGPYLVIPFLGPSDVRDGLGRIPNGYLSPQNYVNDWQLEYSIWGLELLDARYRLVASEPYLDSAYDPYLFMKNAYLQRRDFLLGNAKGGNAPTPSESEADKLLDEATKEEDESQQQAKPPGPQPQGQEIAPPKQQQNQQKPPPN
jgi:phospholipid-binding lipoprotein MlaA